jgi:hypothetical protein
MDFLPFEFSGSVLGLLGVFSVWAVIYSCRLLLAKLELSP